jgi:hypothetical protein
LIGVIVLYTRIGETVVQLHPIRYIVSATNKSLLVAVDFEQRQKFHVNNEPSYYHGAMTSPSVGMV